MYQRFQLTAWLAPKESNINEYSNAQAVFELSGVFRFLITIRKGFIKISFRKFMLDAIPLLRTDAAVTLMRDIVESGQLNDVTLDNWFASLAFYKNPTRAMITTSAVSKAT
jgi:hypothetical protein